QTPDLAPAAKVDTCTSVAIPCLAKSLHRRQSFSLDLIRMGES
ncbi:MAG: hypothetical protein ACI9K5_003072, partial [Gammaproteobacteria bacterium]